MATTDYVHGYHPRETERLHDQAEALADLLHHDTHYPAGARVLEAGSGTGAQTLQLLSRSPGAFITCVDRDAASLASARRRLATAPGFASLQFVHADLSAMPFGPASFDHVFVCFVLEHLADPLMTLGLLLRLLRPGGTITVVEGDHGTACFHPASDHARAVIECQVKLQRQTGGDALIGRRLYPMLAQAGVRRLKVQPRMVYVDGSRPALADSFTRKTFISMIAGTREASLGAGLLTASEFDAGIQALQRTAGAGGVFCYTFFKAQGTVQL